MEADVHVYHHLIDPVRDLAPVLLKLDAIIALLTTQGAQMANELAALESQVTEVQNAEDSAALLLDQLHSLLVAAQSSGDPARIQAVIDSLGASKDRLKAAIFANAVPS